MAVTLHHGDCLTVLRNLPDCTVDAVVTDPPYSYEFMGKKWDRWETPLAFQHWCQAWATECLRVLKPGGHLLAFGGTRTYHRLTCGLEDAGLDIRGTIQWLHGQGFPKHHGALKPAHEPIVLARKPLDSTIDATVARWGTGALNIALCRVDSGPPRTTHADGNRHTTTAVGWRHAVHDSTPPPTGRWPADVVLTHSATCDGMCSPGCPVAELDRQSGTLHSQDPRTRRQGSRNGGTFGLSENHQPPAYWDAGGASRFFPTFRYQAKPSTREKSAGLDDRNHHPTTKPVELMRWLVRLVTPPGGVVLDCFAGSGTTGVAATLEGFDSILIEAEAEYLPLIEGRCRWAEQQTEPQTLPFD